MGGDYTRFTFRSAKRYSEVRQQQGRVALDSDWNEAFDITRHRARLTALDTFGPFGVPQLTTPDAFKIGFVSGPPADLSIQPGRVYVDGIQVELFAGEGASYLHQPFYPAPDPLPASGDAVVYLDVWEREITAIQDPTLLDAALGGVDTTTRLQTVWQVKVAPQAGAKCGVTVGDPPSAGRLTTEAIAPPAPDDPCILPPASGYRGLENQLYRIEVLKGGPAGTATALWSRDNASIVSAVQDMSTSGGRTTLTVDRIGRDQFLRFEIGSLVTVTDDYRELMGEAGDLAKVLDIDEFNNKIVLDIVVPVPGARPFGANPADLKARHTRVQRWDGTLAIPATNAPVPIELGIQVRFSTDPAGGAFRIGDYWAFWARTATAEIEILTAAPPRGIVHHYEQLAAITGLPAPSKITDCRPKLQDEACCCTIVVAVGDDIQKAIDSLPQAGGCICLKTGVHTIASTLTLTRGNVKVEGESAGAVVKIATADTVLAISNADGIEILRVEFQSAGARTGVVSAANVTNGLITGCKLTGGDGAGTAGPSIGIALSACSRFAVTHTTIAGVGRGIQADGPGGADIKFEDNIIERNTEHGHVSGAQVTTGIVVRNIDGPCWIEENVVSGFLEGIVVNDNAGSDLLPLSIARGAFVVRNVIAAATRSGERDGDPPMVAIDVAADESTIAENLIASMGGAAHIGIRATGAGLRVIDNQLAWAPDAAIGGAKGPPGRIGIEIGYFADNKVAPTADARVRGNLVAGFSAGIVVAAALDTVVSENTVALDPTANGTPTGFGILAYLSFAAIVEDNVVTNASQAIVCMAGLENRVSSNILNGTTHGVTLLIEIGSAVDRNQIASAGEYGIVEVMVIGRCDVVENRISNCGVAGVLGFLVMGELHIEANEITDIGPPVSDEQPPPPPVAPPGSGAAPAAPPAVYGIWGAGVLEARIESNLIATSNLRRRLASIEDRAVWMMGLVDFSLLYTPADDTRFETSLGTAIQIADNKFEGSGNSALVELAQIEVLNFQTGHESMSYYVRFTRVIYVGNYCLHATTDANAFSKEAASVQLRGRAASVANNHVKTVVVDPGTGLQNTLFSYASFDFGPGPAPKGNMPGPFMGNVISGPVFNHPVLPTPLSGYNLTNF